jgi:FMN phosphatase YigB (HAD superfamily)
VRSANDLPVKTGAAHTATSGSTALHNVVVDRIKGIIFDLDGTLYRMEWFMRPLLTLQVLPRILMLPRYMKVRHGFSGKDLHDGEALLLAMAAELSRRSIGFSAAQAYRWMNHSFYQAFIAVMCLQRRGRPGLAQTIAKLRSQKIKCAVLSDFAHIDERLRKLSIDPNLFDLRLSSESEGCLKPGVRPFQLIANAWQCKPGQVIVIGDRDDTDGAGARAAGMQFVRITDRKQADVAHWPELRVWLERLADARA